jgi:hypothetical protein
MDPTVAKGTIFTTKGPLNHLISDMWKGTVKKETQIERRWKETYAKELLAEENECVEEMKKAEKRAKEELRPDYCSLPRLDLLRYQREQRWADGRSVTSASAIGASLSSRRSNVLEVERLTSPHNYGKKPVVQSSFFRTSGVF